jgi:catechol 2,3-dioxygenase
MDTVTEVGHMAESAHGIAPAGFRLSPSMRLGPVRLQVADLVGSLAWYSRVLGARLLDQAPGLALLGAEGESRPLIELHEHSGATPVPRRGRLGLYHYAILLPDRSSLGRFVRHLAALGERAGMSDHLVSEAIYLSDPDGLGIEVYADRPRGLWRYQDGQLVMATDPLDVDAVMRAGGPEPWSGLPAGTTIGHVHLYVGDLDQAADFYHTGLGFDKVVWSYPGALFMSAGGYHHHLGTNTWAVGASPAGPNDSRLLEWELTLPSEDEARAALASVAAMGGKAAAGEGGGTATDPWGTTVRLRGSR